MIKPTTTKDPDADGNASGSGSATKQTLVECTADADPTQALVEVAILLHQAAILAWHLADLEGITSGMADLGLGIYSAHGNAVALLAASSPPGHLMTPDRAPAGTPAENNPGQLIGLAETRLRHLASHELAGLSDLVIEVCDLARTAREHKPSRPSVPIHRSDDVGTRRES